MNDQPTSKQRTFLGAPLTKRNTIILVCVGILSLAAGIAAFIITRNFVQGWTLTSLPGAPVAVQKPGATQTQSTNTQSAEDDQIIEVIEESVDLNLDEINLMPDVEPWDGASRINVLFMGLDYRDWEEGTEASRTDTMILFTLDPKTMTAGMLSIPRDLWVQIPGFSHGKINTAYYLGDVYNYPGGGPALASRTVEYFLGVPIHYYVQLDFITFIHIVDELDGVKIDVKEPITVYPLQYPNFDSHRKVVLEPGVVTLPGNYALAYARARNTEGADFDRAARQQELILALRDRILKFNMLPRLVSNASSIYDRLSEGIKTNLTLQQTIQLGLLAMDIDRRDIRTGIIGPTMLYAGKSPDGLDVLITVPDEIRELRDEVFSHTSGASPAGDLSLPALELAIEEEARIGIYNGTLEEGLATSSADYFKELGLNVTDTGNGQQLEATTIYLYNGAPYALRYFNELMSLHISRIRIRFDPEAEVDIAVILGSDWALNNPLP
jgi:polyisoprenyl-teichoic acid--peptidoglycan teichoic acid transferase